MSKFSDSSLGSDGGSSGQQGSGEQEAGHLEAALELDRRMVSSRHGRLREKMRLVGGSPNEAQVEFVKGLLDNPGEARDFVSNPKKYSLDHGVLLDPDMVRDVTTSLLFDVNVDDSVLRSLGTRGGQTLLDMRANHSVAAVPAAVVAGAAVVAAAAAVVEAVVTVVRTSKVEDLHILKGLGPGGITMPGGGAFRF